MHLCVVSRTIQHLQVALARPLSLPLQLLQVLQIKKEEEEKKKKEEEEELARIEREREQLRKNRERELRLKARQDEEVGQPPHSLAALSA